MITRFPPFSCCYENSGTYAIPFGDYLSFEELDQRQYESYRAMFIDGPDPPPFDASARLGFWCVSCPVGADCADVGRSLGNVTAQEGYFMGVDGTGKTFFICLNADACNASGCATGYAGDSCTECDTGLVLSDGFKCEYCPSEWMTVLAFLSGLIAFGAYLVYKVQIIESGQTISLTSVFTKITLSTCQVCVPIYYLFVCETNFQYIHPIHLSSFLFLM